MQEPWSLAETHSNSSERCCEAHIHVSTSFVLIYILNTALPKLLYIVMSIPWPLKTQPIPLFDECGAKDDPTPIIGRYRKGGERNREGAGVLGGRGGVLGSLALVPVGRRAWVCP